MHRHGNRPDVTIWACVFHFCLSYFSDWKTWIEIIGIYIFFFKKKKNFILLVERKPHVRCTEIKKKKSYIFHSDEYYSFWVKKETVLRRLEG